MSTFMRLKRRTHQQKRRRQPLKKKNDGYGCTREEKGGLDGDGLIDNTREDMKKKYELT